jgi:NitT/TauT family transport system substrate-binding protein
MTRAPRSSRRSAMRLALAAVSIAVIAACGGAKSGGSATAASTDSSGGDVAPESADVIAPPTRAPGATIGIPAQVTVRFGGTPSAEQAGLFAADVQGFFRDENIDVLFDPLGPGGDPFVTVAGAEPADFMIGWLPAVFEVRAKGGDQVVIAQIVRRSDTRLVALAGGTLKSAKDLKGVPTALLEGDRGVELAAAMAAAGLAPATDLVASTDPFDPSALLDGTLKAAEVGARDGYAAILETPDATTGKQLPASGLTSIDLGTEHGVLQDAIVVRASWLADPKNADVAVRFLRAVFRGWAYCRDDAAGCAQFAVDAGSERGLGHQAWMMNETNGLIWPAPDGIGAMDPTGWDRTAAALQAAGRLAAAPDNAADRTDIAAKAREGLKDLDLMGAGFTKAADVPITPNGE